MTKKRFIKRLMGELRFPRNKAKLFANDIYRWHEIYAVYNATWKKIGGKTRGNPPTYSEYYALIKITELSKQLTIQEGESKWNSITKSSS